MDALDIEGAWILTPELHTDRRGSFHEWLNCAKLERLTGRRLEVAQANCSVSRRGVVRGVHFSDVPPGQAKYVTCVSGAILDVIVDLRVGSANFGRYVTVPLTSGSKETVFIEEGLGHAFVSLSNDAAVMYLCSTPYQPDREHVVHAFDPAIGVEWPDDLVPILSDKDAAAPSLALALADGMLPDYASCLAARQVSQAAVPE